MRTHLRYEDLLPRNHALFAATRFDRETVADFLLLFSRAEYALKAAGLVSAGAADAPQISWDRFANTLPGKLSPPPDPAIADALQYLQHHPPDRQVLKQGHLRWLPRTISSGQSEEAFLIRSITTVRNNLFHGGKELARPFAERDRLLVRSALLVLAYALSRHETVLAAYLDAGPDVAVA